MAHRRQGAGSETPPTCRHWTIEEPAEHRLAAVQSGGSGAAQLSKPAKGHIQKEAYSNAAQVEA
ncbi:MAG: hypothetical protein N2515_10375, partial [Deltaproteobacteria bacterium]|nr:hypothetical protein [Deltaproteobacteria bacterium]